MVDLDQQERIRLGFNGWLRDCNGASLRYKLKQFRRELKEAWQRAWRGYSDSEWYNLDNNLRNRLYVLLGDLDNKRISLFTTPEYNEDKFCYSDKETSDIIQTMRFHLLWMDNDYVYEQLYPNDGLNFVKEHWDRCASIAAQNKRAFFKLFELFYWDLWD